MARTKRQPKSNSIEHQMARSLDQLAEFERYNDEVAPILRKALSEGWSAEKLYSHPKVEALLAARALTIGLTERDSGKALTAIKEAMDRSKGKSTERREVKHQLQNLPDEQLDAALETLMSESPDDDQAQH